MNSTNSFILTGKGKGKSILVQAYYRPIGFQEVEAHECGKDVSLTHRTSLPPRNYSWYSFTLEAQSTPRPFQSLHLEPNPVPQPVPHFNKYCL